jgi:hypothetical protein
MLITDYGTEFGVIHVPGSTDELHVIKGSVNARALSGLKAEETLTDGESRLVNVRGELMPAPKLSAPFTKQLPDKLPYLHFPFDEIEADQTVADGEHPALGSLSTRLIQSDDRAPSSRLIPGRFGQAIQFDGKGDLISTDWPGVFGAQPVTVAFWIKPEGRPNYAGIVSWGAGKSLGEESQQWKIVVTPEQERTEGRVFRCAWGARQFNEVPIDLPDDVWTHLAVVYTGDSSGMTPTLRFYINGVKSTPKRHGIPSPPRRPADLATAQHLMFGHPLDWAEGTPEYLGNFLHGALDEVFIIEGALTRRQINRLIDSNVYEPNRTPAIQ